MARLRYVRDPLGTSPSLNVSAPTYFRGGTTITLIRSEHTATGGLACIGLTNDHDGYPVLFRAFVVDQENPSTAAMAASRNVMTYDAYLVNDMNGDASHPDAIGHADHCPYDTMAAL